jgi:hypothetical protein
MTANNAFQLSALDQENTLTLAAQSLTKLGITNEDTYRYAALKQNKGFHDETVRLREYEFGKDESFRIAQSEIQEKQFATTQEFRDAIENRALDIQQNGLDQRAILQQAEQTWRKGEGERTRQHDVDMMARANKNHRALMDELFGEGGADKDQWKDETDGKWADDWTKGDDGFWYDGDHSNSATGERTEYRHSTKTTNGNQYQGEYDENNPPPGGIEEWEWDGYEWVDEMGEPYD